MERQEQGSGAQRRSRLKKADALACVLLVYLFPVLVGGVFFRVMEMGGAPSWWLIVNGALFAASLGQAIYFLASGIVPALKKALSRDLKGRDAQ
ncbi:MAG: hypothetical protein IJ124_12835 [Clostridia bacterium]|nr:hypothetical protein [Clostridia bacterium]